jgi:hypothetical protein
LCDTHCSLREVVVLNNNYILSCFVCVVNSPPPSNCAVSPRHKKVQNVTNFCLWCDTIQYNYITPPHLTEASMQK